MRISRLASVVFFISLFLLTSCVTAVRTIAGFKDPKVESKEGITSFLQKIDPTQETYFLKIDQAKDSVAIYKNLIFGFNSDILMFNSQTGEKYCYQGEEECSGVQMRSAFQEFESNYNPCPTESQIPLDRFLNRLVNAQGEPVDRTSLPQTDYYVFQTWNKYIQSKKYLKEDLNWLLDLKKNSNLSIEIILVNTDLLDDWGLKKGEELPLKLKKKGKTLSMSFGNLPLEEEPYE